MSDKIDLKQQLPGNPALNAEDAQEVAEVLVRVHQATRELQDLIGGGQVGLGADEVAVPGNDWQFASRRPMEYSDGDAMQWALSVPPSQTRPHTAWRWADGDGMQYPSGNSMEWGG